MHSRPMALSTQTSTAQATLQTASYEAIVAHQLARLRAGLDHVLASNRFYHNKLAGLDPQSLVTLDAFRALPFTLKSELVSDQAAHPPYGTNLTYPLRNSCACTRLPAPPASRSRFWTHPKAGTGGPI